MGPDPGADFTRPSTGAARPPAAASQRDRLLAGMATTVAAQGYAQTSVADVLRAARISRRTFYERFSDKEDCFLAAYDEIVAVCLARVRAAYCAARSWRDGVSEAVRALLQALADEPDFAQLGVVEVLGSGPRGLERRDATLRQFAAYIEHSRARAPQPAGGPPELVAQAIVGGIHELLYSHLVRGEADRLPQLGDELLHYTFMLLGEPRHTT